MYIGENALLREIYEELDEKLGERVYKAFSNPNFLEVLSGRSSEAKALDFFLKAKGLTPDNLLVMGTATTIWRCLSLLSMGLLWRILQMN